MRSYLDILEVSPLGDARTWILRDGFYYEYRDVGEGTDYRIDVPPRFMTDYASTPRFLWWFVKPWGNHGMAAVIHDWLYWEQKLPGRDLDRGLADEIFLRCMVDSGVNPRKARLMHLAVKWFARGAWNGNQRKKNAGWHRVALRWPESAFDIPQDLQTTTQD